MAANLHVEPSVDVQLGHRLSVDGKFGESRLFSHQIGLLQKM